MAERVLGCATGDSETLHELVHPAGQDTEQVAGRHHAGQGPLRALPAFQPPLREVGALTWTRIGDRDVERAAAGVEVTVPVSSRRLIRSGLVAPYSAPQTASASAKSGGLIKV